MKDEMNVLDASAIIKLVIDEQGSDSIVDYCGEDAVFHTTSICFSEAVGYLKSLRYFQNSLSDDKYLAASNNLMTMLKNETIQINTINLYDKKDWVGVEKLTDKYSVDISEAFQVYALKNGFFSDKEKYQGALLITGDSNLAKTAKAEKIPVWNCIEDD